MHRLTAYIISLDIIALVLALLIRPIIISEKILGTHDACSDLPPWSKTHNDIVIMMSDKTAKTAKGVAAIIYKTGNETNEK